MIGAGAVYENWCTLRGVQPVPSKPEIVAQFVTDCASLGIEKLWELIGQISRAHYLNGYADPTLGGYVSTAINDVSKIEPPRAWPKQYKVRFLSLPYDLQVYVASHEAQREKEVRRAHNEAAELRKQLEKLKEAASDKTLAA